MRLMDVRFKNFVLVALCLAVVGCGQTTNQTAPQTETAAVRTDVKPAPAVTGVGDPAVDSGTETAAAEGAQTTELATVDNATEATDATDATETEDTDIISAIIWDLQAAQTEPPVAVTPVIPEGPDPSLANDALAAAFAMLSRPTESVPDFPAFAVPEKAENALRIALLVPMSGPHAALGAELRRGAELALFAIGDRRLELVVFDTAATAVSSENGMPINGAALAATQAADAAADIIIGPLFSDAVVPARAVAKMHNIPMLLLSNNTDVGGHNSWLMGYVPEQQLDLVLAHALSNGSKKFAVLAEDSPFGLRLKRHAEKRLSTFGVPIIESRVLTPAELADETQLKSAIKSFARYQDQQLTDADQTDLPDPAYDAVIFAGDANFALRTAPVLAFYDIGSDRVSYLGNALWKQTQLLIEPSLQNSVFAARPSKGDGEFTALWTQTWADRPGLLARLSFDALAMIGLLAREPAAIETINWSDALTNANGFSGFSGAFRLLPDGSNLRAFELRQIVDGAAMVVVQAPDKI